MKVGDRLISDHFPGSYVELLSGDGTSGNDLWHVVGFNLPNPDTYTQPDLQQRLVALGTMWGELKPDPEHTSE